MRINLLMLLMLILFITGCTIRTTGNVVIEDAVDQSTGNVIIEDVAEEQETAEIEEQEEGATEEQEAAESEEQEAEATETTTTEETEQPEETTTTPETTAPEIVGKLISIENLKFVPETLTISKGETVTWQHNDKYLEHMKHMVRIYPRGDASPMMYYGDVFSYTFNEPGEYNFMDIIYKESDVRGKIIVE